MAPLPADGTARVFLRYTSGGLQHTVQMRPMVWSGPTTATTLVSVMGPFIQGFLPDTDGVQDAFYCIPNSSITVPLTFTPLEGTATATPFAEDPESAFISFCGKDVTYGRRWRFDIFTPLNVFSSWPADNRYNPGDNVSADSVLADAKALFEPGDDTLGIGTIAGEPLVLKNYINIAKNSYWQRRQRV